MSRRNIEIESIKIDYICTVNHESCEICGSSPGKSNVTCMTFNNKSWVYLCEKCIRKNEPTEEQTWRQKEDVRFRNNQR